MNKRRLLIALYQSYKSGENSKHKFKSLKGQILKDYEQNRTT